MSISNNTQYCAGQKREHKMSLPKHIEDDLVAGFILTDEDDGYQRCKKLSKTTYLYRCEVNGETYEEEVDVTKINQEEAIDGYYDSIEAVIEEYGSLNSNMIIAECYFENSCPMQTPN